MKSFKIHKLNEDKIHFVKKLKNLTRDEKKRITKKLKKYPALGNDIDWKNKNLNITDFQVMLHSRSKTKVKKDVKSKGISGLKKGTDYEDVSYMFDSYNAYMPLNYEASKYIASKYIGNCTGEWCTAENTDQWWEKYTNTYKMSFIYIISYDKEEKFAIALNKKLSKINIFDRRDNEVTRIPYDNAYSIVKRNKKNLIKNSKKVDRGYDDVPYWFKSAITSSAKFEIIRNKFIWKDGTWKGGDWFGSKWEKGYWYSGIWHKGLWKKGLWWDGTWLSGTWEGGTWEKGLWKAGTWYIGIWKDGLWEDGTWESGIWHKGLWKKGLWWDGTWMAGMWEDGRWIKGIWYNGTWIKGIWVKGTWYRGIWKIGRWKGGTWEAGTWEDGTWEKGTWWSGKWKDGLWEDGTWKGGTWEAGTWIKGTWEGGRWLGGYDKDGNFHDAGDSPDKWGKE